MHYAKSMYKGGVLVCAFDKLDYSSYLRKGLRCLDCGEEIQLKSGEKRERHFAHYKALDSSSKCSFRVTKYSQSWSDFTPKGRGQRRKLFQEYFLYLIKKSKPDFELNIQSIKDVAFFEILRKFIDECCKCFYHTANDLIANCRILNERNCDKNLVLQKLIAGEAIDYLSILSSHKLLEYLVYYSISLSCKFKYLKYSNEKTWINNIKPIDICYQIKEILISIDWLSAFDKDIVDGNNLEHIPINQVFKSNPMLTLENQDLRTQPVLQRQNEAFSFSNNPQNNEISFECVSPKNISSRPRYTRISERESEAKRQLDEKIHNLLKNCPSGPYHKIEVKCPWCNVMVRKACLRRHVYRKHYDEQQFKNLYKPRKIRNLHKPRKS